MNTLCRTPNNLLNFVGNFICLSFALSNIKNTNDMTTTDFSNFLQENNIKFTKPQQAIVDKLLLGWKLTVVNTHHMSGGDYMWLEYPGAEPSYAGRVYKAFWNIEYAIKKQTGIKFDMSVFRQKYQA